MRRESGDHQWAWWSATVDLLLVEPVEAAEQVRLVAAEGQRARLAASRADHLQVGIAHEGNPRAIGGEGLPQLLGPIARQARGASGVEPVDVEVAVLVEEREPAVLGERVGGAPGQLAGLAGVEARLCREGRLHGLGIMEFAPGPGGGVDHHQAGLALLVLGGEVLRALAGPAAEGTGGTGGHLGLRHEFQQLIEAHARGPLQVGGAGAA